MKKKNLLLNLEKVFGLAGSPTAKNTYLSFIGNGFFSFFTMVAMVLISRSLGPEEFGIFSVLFSFAIITFDLSSLGLDQALVRFVSFNLSRGKRQRANQFIKAIFKIRVITALFLIISGFFLSPFLSELFFSKANYRWLLNFVFIGTANIILLGGFFSSVLRARQDFLKDAFFHFIRGFFRVCLIFLLFFLKRLTLVSANLVFSLYSWVFLPILFLFIPQDFHKARPQREIYNKLFSFSKWIYLWAITATIHSKLDIFMLERLKGSYHTGLYSAALRLVMIYTTLISSFSLVLLPKISSIESFAHFSAFFKKIIFSLIGFFGAIILGILFSKPLTLFLFGREYADSVPTLKILLLGVVFMALSLPFATSLTAWAKTKIIGLISTTQLILVFVSNLILIDKFGSIGAAITYNLSNFLALTLSIVFYLRELKLRKIKYEI